MKGLEKLRVSGMGNCSAEEVLGEVMSSEEDLRETRSI
jgi:hypothetical protein